MPDGEIGRIDDDTSFRIQRSGGADADGRDLIEAKAGSGNRVLVFERVKKKEKDKGEKKKDG